MDAEIQGYLTEFGILRGQVRDAINGMSNDAANWHPLSEGTNSVYAILSHVIGADRFWVHQVIGGETVQRDREADFASSGDLSELLDRWDREWADIESLLGQLTHGQLLETRTVSFRAEPRSFTIQWIILHLISHYATHLGHIQLTAQMWSRHQT